MSPQINQSVLEHIEGVLSAGRELEVRIRQYDWSSTPLGPIAAWPQSLTTATNILLSSPCPMFIWWGRQMTLLYNDAAVPLCSVHHPHALGEAGQMLWPNVLESVEHAVGETLSRGQPFRQPHCVIPVEHNGCTQECHFTFSYSPLMTDEGRIGGVFCVCNLVRSLVPAFNAENLDGHARPFGTANSTAIAQDESSTTAMLLQSEQRFRLFAENGPQMILGTNAQGVPEYVNPRWTEYTGLTLASSADKRHLQSVVHSDDWSKVVQRLRLGSATSTCSELELRIKRAHDGSFRWFVCHTEPVKDHGDNSSQWLVVLTDINDKKRAEEALQEKIEELQTLMDTIPIGVFIALDPECRKITGNPAAHALLRTQNDNLSKSAPAPEQPTHFRVCRNGVEIPAEDLPVQRAARGEVVRNEEVDDHFDDGTILHTLMSAAPLHDKQGRVRGAVATVLDVTARKQAENALRESESRFRLALRDSSVLVYTTDDQLRYTWVHNAHPAFQVEDVIGRRDDELLPLEFAAPLMELKQRVLEQGVGERGECSVKLDDTELVYSLNVEPIHVQGKGVVGVTVAALDITHRVEAERRIKGLLEQLQVADQRKNDFLATLAHELRNPLAPIRNGLQLMKLAKDDPSIIDQCHIMMERQLGQLVRLVDDLLDISRINQGKLVLRKERINLAEIVDNAIETSRPLIESMNHKLVLDFPAEPILVEADAARLAQVVMNLLNNAAKYSDPDGHIKLVVKQQGEEAVISIADKGIGIAPDQLPHIFNIFSQIESSLARSQGGLGIGLSLVKRLVELHYGSVEVKSEGIGKGSEFIVRIPARSESAVLHESNTAT